MTDDEKKGPNVMVIDTGSHLIVAAKVDLDDETDDCPVCGVESTSVSSGAVSNAYRKGWDNIFGNKTLVGQS